MLEWTTDTVLVEVGRSLWLGWLLWCAAVAVMMLARMPELDRSIREALPWLLVAAVGLYLVGTLRPAPWLALIMMAAVYGSWRLAYALMPVVLRGRARLLLIGAIVAHIAVSLYTRLI